jgi:hypothetical protein
VIAEDEQTLVSSVLNQPPPIADITVDVSTIVSNWVNGVYPNQGFVLTYDRNDFQGAGFDELELVLVPEPGSLALLVIALAPLLGRRSRP